MCWIRFRYEAGSDEDDSFGWPMIVGVEGFGRAASADELNPDIGIIKREDRDEATNELVDDLIDASMRSAIVVEEFQGLIGRLRKYGRAKAADMLAQQGEAAE